MVGESYNFNQESFESYMSSMRLDKFLSEASSYSRKEIRNLVRHGLISVDRVIARSPDQKVNENTPVTIKGIPVKYQKYIYLMLNKPAGYLSATEDDRDPVVTDLVPEQWRHFKVFPVGRLDKDTEGLLLLTNDGQFDHALMSPKKNLYKRYYAELSAPADSDDVQAFREGMALQDFTAKPAKLELTTEAPSKVYVEIAEGKYHQVKRMCSKRGKEVLYLKRVAIGNLLLDQTLSPGQMRELTEAELALFTF